MGYISSEDVKKIREKIKEKYGDKYKFSVTTQHNSTVNICIMEGVKDFTNPNYDRNDHSYGREKQYTKAYYELEEKLLDVCREVNQPSYYETGDYGTQPSYYKYVQLGQWDKEYIYNPSYGKKTVKKQATTKVTVTQTKPCNAMPTSTNKEVYKSNRGAKYTKQDGTWYSPKNEALVLPVQITYVEGLISKGILKPCQ